AIAAAHPGNTINVSPGTYPERLTISQSLTLTGVGGAGRTTIDATGLGGRVVTVLAGQVTLRGLLLTGGLTSAGGGGLYNAAGAVLNLADVTVVGNNAAPGPGSPGGGGVYNAGNLTMATVTVSNNSAAFHGGGIDNSGTLSLATSTVSSNT